MEHTPFFKAKQWRVVLKDQIVGDGLNLLVESGKASRGSSLFLFLSLTLRLTLFVFLTRITGSCTEQTSRPFPLSFSQ